MKKQNSYFVEEREIEGKKMFAQILKRWRLVLLLAVIGAVMAVAADYRMMKKSAAEDEGLTYLLLQAPSEPW